ncbi:DUF2790 domain-containing protein [Pseudomonas sp. ITA]|uniref:DUF2790 domain-containing protein n=1 Tax=Pseudomonas sp. ITA TaxID=2825841 RepID=UPI0024982699|nr:DUF2790 domain-containing protein [Pseudomonas sp. ITA]MDI2146200.1 DUF2790 domain-containing protein [Pseudomonas sp. ITA]
MKIIALMLMTFFVAAVFADSDEQPVRTDTKLDIVKTISITDTSNACGIVPVELKYEDSNGEQRTVSYQVWGTGCSGG